jgi:hypothetical protein
MTQRIGTGTDADVRAVGWNREGRVVDERIAAKWFTLLADRVGRPIEAATVLEYLTALDKASVSDEAVDLALRDVFNAHDEYRWPTPASIVGCAKLHQERINNRMAHRQLPSSVAPSFETGLYEARQWAKQNPEQWDRLRKVVDARVKVFYPHFNPDAMTVMQRAFREGVILKLVAQAKVTGELPDADDPAPLVDSAALRDASRRRDMSRHT